MKRKGIGKLRRNRKRRIVKHVEKEEAKKRDKKGDNLRQKIGMAKLPKK